MNKTAAANCQSSRQFIVGSAAAGGGRWASAHSSAPNGGTCGRVPEVNAWVDQPDETIVIHRRHQGAGGRSRGWPTVAEELGYNWSR
jgi:hypothetical protein